jgi:mannose-1-phosphate guanylyltransferase
MFCFKAGIFLEELKKYSPEIYDTSFHAYENSKNSTQHNSKNYDNMIRITHEDMINIPEDSIDYAVMEKSNKVKVVASDIDWSDMGSFDALCKELESDHSQNRSLSVSNYPIEHIYNNSKNNLIISDKLVTAIDVDDLIIVDTADALLISKKGSGQKIKDAVKVLKQRDSELPNIHLTAHRPWGTYTVLEDTPGYKIKRIEVKPGKRLSLQNHLHRNEHWIVVSGTATVTVGKEIKLVRPNESTYIKMGEIHRLENQGKIPVVLIEAQVGEYTGEDDIVRIEDDFQRIK